jgi:hypothetical protein
MKKFDQLFLFLNENAAGVTQDKPKTATTQFFKDTSTKSPEYIAAEELMKKIMDKAPQQEIEAAGEKARGLRAEREEREKDNKRISPVYWVTNADFKAAFGRSYNPMSSADQRDFFQLVKNAPGARRRTDVPGASANEVIASRERPEYVPTFQNVDGINVPETAFGISGKEQKQAREAGYSSTVEKKETEQKFKDIQAKEKDTKIKRQAASDALLGRFTKPWDIVSTPKPPEPEPTPTPKPTSEYMPYADRSDAGEMPIPEPAPAPEPEPAPVPELVPEPTPKQKPEISRFPATPQELLAPSMRFRLSKVGKTNLPTDILKATIKKGEDLIKKANEYARGVNQNTFDGEILPPEKYPDTERPEFNAYDFGGASVMYNKFPELLPPVARFANLRPGKRKVDGQHGGEGVGMYSPKPPQTVDPLTGTLYTEPYDKEMENLAYELERSGDRTMGTPDNRFVGRVDGQYGGVPIPVSPVQPVVGTQSGPMAVPSRFPATAENKEVVAAIRGRKDSEKRGEVSRRPRTAQDLLPPSMRIRAAKSEPRKRFEFDTEIPASVSQAISRLSPTSTEFPQQAITAPQIEPTKAVSLPKYLTVSALWYDLIGKDNPELKGLSEKEMKDQLLRMDLNLAKDYPNLFSKEDFEEFAEFNPIMGSGSLPYELDIEELDKAKIPGEVVDTNKKVIPIPSEGKKTNRKINKLLK